MKTAILFLLCCLYASATTYYVSNSGSDSNNGTTTGTPWQTIAHVNAQAFSAGDSILLQAGGTWHEQLMIPSSGTSGNNITVGSYGTGAQPIVSGADAQTWTNTSGNVWHASVGVVPNVVIFSGALGTPVASLAAVTAATDYYYSSGTLSIYDASTPDATILVGARQSAVDTNGKSYLTISGLDLIGANGYPGASYSYLAGGDVFINNSSNVTISGCTLELAGNFGMKMMGATNITVSGNTIQNIGGDKGFTRGDGIDVWGVSNISDINAPTGSAPSTNIVITGNTLQGYFDRQGIAIEYASNVTISNNTITYGGPWNAIDFEPGGYPTSWSTTDSLVSGNTITMEVPSNADAVNALPSYGIGIGTSSAGTATSGITIDHNQIDLNNLSTTGAIESNCSTGTCMISNNTVTNEGVASLGFVIDCHQCTVFGNALSATAGHVAYYINSGNLVSTVNAIVTNNSATGSFNNSGFSILGSATTAMVADNTLINGTLGDSVPTNGTFGMTVNITSANSSATIYHNHITAWQYGIQVSSGASASVGIDNNTIVGSYYGIRIPAGVTDTITANNNLVAWLGTASTTVYFVYAASMIPSGNNNLYYYPNDSNARWYWGAAKTTLAAWQTSSGMDSNAVVSNPQFVNYSGGDFSLQSISPARNAGLRIAGINQQISEGVPDIGAFEYAPGKLGTNSATKLNNRYKVATVN